MKILIADDESKLRQLLSDFFKGEGYEVAAAADGREALEIFGAEGESIDLIILDVMMPYVDGWRVCKEIRKTSRVPIIMLTAKSEEADELESFEKGANDYIPKPFSLNVLLARVHARIDKPGEHGLLNMLKYNGLIINQDTHEISLDGKPLTLTPIEYEVMVLLIRNKGKVYSREQLLSLVWGYDYYGGDRTVDTHMGRLRNKLGGFGEKYLKTIRGYGYKLDA